MNKNKIEGLENKTYKVSLEGDVLKLSFGTPAQNDQIVKDAVEAVRDLGLEGGKIIKLNGPASLPVAIALSHEVGHIYGAIAAFDPKLGKYVVAISHDPELKIGDLID
jgi:CRISPR-associated protein Csx3